MTVDKCTPLSVSLYKPLVVVDVVEGQWFAVVSDGTTQVQVTEWPLRDQRFDVDASTVLHIELYLAEDDTKFLNGQGRKFADVHVPATKVWEVNEGGFYRGWLGLQRGYHYPPEQSSNVDVAAQLYDISAALAQNLLTPKICCSVVEEGLADRLSAQAMNAQAGGEPGGRGTEAPLRRSLMQHGNLIAHMHRQLRTLWSQGKLVCTERSNGDLAAQLADVSLENDQMSGLGYDPACDLDTFARYQDKLIRMEDSVTDLTNRLEESEQNISRQYQLKLKYRERLAQVTGEQLEDDHEILVQVADGCREAWKRQLEESLQDERARNESLQQQLRESERMRVEACQQHQMCGESRFMDGSADGEELQRRVDQLNQLVQLHLMEIQSLHSNEREQRGLLQELRQEHETSKRDLVQREAEVKALREELQERTTRLVESWSLQGRAEQSSLRTGDTRPAGGSVLVEAELEGARREAASLKVKLQEAEEKLREAAASRRSADSEEAAGADDAPGLGGFTERLRLVHEELQRDGAAPTTDRENALSCEVESLTSQNERLRRDLESLRSSGDEQSRRVASAEERSEQLQREVDRVMGEAIMHQSKMLDRDEHELTLRQQVKTLTLRQEQVQREATGQSELRRSNEALATEVQRLRSDASALEASGETECRELRAEAARVQALNTELGGQLTALSDRDRDSAVELQEARGQLLQQDSVIRDLHSAQEPLRADALRKEAALAQAQEAQREAVAQLQSSQEQRSADGLQLGELRAAAAELQQSRAEAAVQGQELERQRAALRTAEDARGNAVKEEQQLQSELRRREAAAREREEELQAEIRDLEDANDEMQQQAQRQFDEMSLLQENITAEILDFRKEQGRGVKGVA